MLLSFNKWKMKSTWSTIVDVILFIFMIVLIIWWCMRFFHFWYDLFKGIWDFIRRIFKGKDDDNDYENNEEVKEEKHKTITGEERMKNNRAYKEYMRKHPNIKI